MLPAALTILLSSFLLFLVQPIVAKQILPWFGGSASVWTVCVMFFQTVLVLGYAYAHLLTRHFTGRRQLLVHGVLLLASCTMLPIIASPSWKVEHGSDPAVRILGLLAVTVGLPYFLLASTGPLLQKWLSGASGSLAGRSVYRLFALSNLGSLAGLLSYPFAVEPFITLRVQAWVWSMAYAVFVICSINYVWTRAHLTSSWSQVTPALTTGSGPSVALYAYWIGCSALGSVLLLAGTNQITQNVAAVPLLWILPLSLYLLSFIVCFEGRSGQGWYQRRFWVTPAMLAAGAMAWALSADLGYVSAYIALPVYAVGIFLGCVMCHGELARTKPETEHLTHFYLSLASGGALGGLLVGLVAPRVFSGYWEMPLALAALTLLGLHCCREERRRPRSSSWSVNLGLAAAATVLILLLLGGLPSALDSYTLGWAKMVQGDARWGCAVLLISSAALLQTYHLWRTVALTALACTLSFDWLYYHGLAHNAQILTRNFYGALRVIDFPYRTEGLRQLWHGTILHGSEVLQGTQRTVPTTYYGASSGIGLTLSSEHGLVGALRIGSVGLGAGTLAAYGRVGDLFRVYELNPAVLDIARNQFGYLSDSKARIEPVLGDARVSLEREVASGQFDRPEQRYDVLSLDAFSGDAIPVHLLTREAFAAYGRVTKPDGVIAFHVSNRFLDLSPIVAQLARDAGFHAVLVADRPLAGLTKASDWVLVTRNERFLEQPDIASRSRPIVLRAGLPEWTDQFTNLVRILK